MGSDDTNDATQYRDCYNETDANLIWEDFRKDMAKGGRIPRLHSITMDIKILFNSIPIKELDMKKLIMLSLI